MPLKITSATDYNSLAEILSRRDERDAATNHSANLALLQLEAFPHPNHKGNTLPEKLEHLNSLIGTENRYHEMLKEILAVQRALKELGVNPNEPEPLQVDDGFLNQHGHQLGILPKDEIVTARAALESIELLLAEIPQDKIDPGLISDLERALKAIPELQAGNVTFGKLITNGESLPPETLALMYKVHSFSQAFPCFLASEQNTHELTITGLQDHLTLREQAIHSATVPVTMGADGNWQIFVADLDELGELKAKKGNPFASVKINEGSTVKSLTPDVRGLMTALFSGLINRIQIGSFSNSLVRINAVVHKFALK